MNSGDERDIFTATAGWITLMRTSSGWTALNEATGQAASWREGTGSVLGVDDSSWPIRVVLEEVGVSGHEAAILSRVIDARQEIN